MTKNFSYPCIENNRFELQKFVFDETLGKQIHATLDLEFSLGRVPAMVAQDFHQGRFHVGTTFFQENQIDVFCRQGLVNIFAGYYIFPRI